VATVHQAAAADIKAQVTEAWQAFHAEIYSFLVRTTRSAPEAEDLTQEAFLRLTRAATAGESPDQVRAWLYRVAANLAVSRGRRWLVARRWFMAAAGNRDIETAPSPESTSLARERAAALDRALASLERDARVALLLSAEGVSGQEIAETIGRTPSATRTLMCRARLKLRAALSAGGER
jgi:RNA polymerase sigma-70 factor (ECF subfamily)